jgi:hypothetical protein
MAFKEETQTHLNVIAALVIGHPITKDLVESRVTSETSLMQVDSQRSDKGTWYSENSIKWPSNVDLRKVNWG